MDEKQTGDEEGRGGRGEGEEREDSSIAPSKDDESRRKRLGDNAEDEKEYFTPRDPSDRGSIPGDEFRDSAIDSASLSSQLNIREELADAETMKTGELMKPQDYPSDNLNRSNDFHQGDAMSDQHELKTETIVQDSNLNSDHHTLDERGIATIEGSGEAATDSTDKVTDLEEDDSQQQTSVVQCGIIRMTFVNDADRHRLSVTVHEAKDIPGCDRVNLSHSEIHLLLNLTSKKIRHKTKPKTGENPQFEETFHFKCVSEELKEQGFRVRLYRSETFKKERVMGEAYVNVSSILSSSKNNPHTTWITLEPRFNLMNFRATDDEQPVVGVDDPSSQSMSGPELMIGLAYNSNTGRLTVEVVQGCRFKSSNSQKPPDTFVKLKLIAPNGGEIARSKTTVKRKQPNPGFKEIFMFHVPRIQLPDVSLMISVCEHRSLKHSQILGWFTLGHTNSSDESKMHWTQMIEKKDEVINQWHSLLNP